MSSLRRIAVAVNVTEPHPQHQAVFSGVLQYAREQGNWQCFTDEHPLYESGERRGIRGSYDGVIARADLAMQDRLAAKGVPLVNTHYQQHRPGLHGVYMDVSAMGQMAAEHLIGRGYRRYAIFHGPHSRQTREVVAAFRNRLELDELAHRTEPIPEGDTADPGFWTAMERTMLTYLNQLEPPVAVLIDSAITARVLVELCEHRGLHVPQDVAVLTILNPATLLDIPTSISSILDNYHEVGYQAAVRLDKLMRGEVLDDEPVWVPSVGIAARASTDYFAVEDPVVAEALRYISANLNSKINVQQIADELAVSLRTLYTRFEAALGRTIASEIRRLRVSSARLLLAEPSLSLQQVADRAGFGSVDAMTRQFKSAYGMTPTSYRDHHYG